MRLHLTVFRTRSSSNGSSALG